MQVDTSAARPHRPQHFTFANSRISNQPRPGPGLPAIGRRTDAEAGMYASFALAGCTPSKS